MGYSKKNIYKESDVVCKYCKVRMIEVSHKEITRELLNKSYYFNKWYKCDSCKRQFNYEEDKVKNLHSSVTRLIEEAEQNNLFISSL